MKPINAIAAMAENRVIGCNGKLPWHLPDDFNWFKTMTTGNVVIMGRKTFESLSKPLSHRTTVVFSRSAFYYPGVRTVSHLSQLDLESEPREVFICGGAQIYAQLLPCCTDLYLTLVKKNAQGNVFFPRFEDRFELSQIIRDHPEFKILRYRNRVVDDYSQLP